jgi:hypothetical protein
LDLLAIRSRDQAISRWIEAKANTSAPYGHHGLPAGLHAVCYDSEPGAVLVSVRRG